MKHAQILGMEPSSICILADVLQEIGLADHLDIFLNIELDQELVTPVATFPNTVHPPESRPDANSGVIFGPSGPRNKAAIYRYYTQHAGLTEKHYLTIKHPTSYVATRSHLAPGVLIEPLVTISSQTHIGFGVTIKRSCSIGHHNLIGDYTDLNPGVVTSGRVVIGRGCIIGSGAVIKNGVQIGENTFIGMGSVVTKDVPPHSIAFGNPCTVMRTNDIWSI